MCHLALAIPLLALPVLWLLPPAAAITFYAVALAAAAVVYVFAVKAMRKPVCTGREDLLRAVGKVRELHGKVLTVWVKSELWSAEDGDEAIAVGDSVEIVGLDGLRLRVRKRCAIPQAHEIEQTSGP